MMCLVAYQPQKKEVINMNVNMLKGKIVEKGMNVLDVANRMNIDKSTLYRKLNANGETFTVKDVKDITCILELSSEDVMNIFFTK